MKSVLWPALNNNAVDVSLSGGSLGYWISCNNFKRHCTLLYCDYGDMDQLVFSWNFQDRTVMTLETNLEHFWDNALHTFLGLCLLPTLYNDRKMDILEILTIWTQKAIGQSVSLDSFVPLKLGAAEVFALGMLFVLVIFHAYTYLCVFVCIRVCTFIPCSVLILASDWLTTVKYGAVSHVWRHQREI